MNRLIALRLHVALLACAGLGLGSLACADIPSAAEAAPPAPAAAETAPAAASTPAPPTASTPAKTAAPSGANATSEEREKHFKAEGYKVQTHNGQKLFCRVDVGTGTHIPREHCYTEDVLANAEAKAPSSVDFGNSSTRPPGLTPIPASH
jgi:hypothetical protein